MASKLLLTGCCGTIGQQIISELASQNTDLEVTGVDNNESALFSLTQKYGKRFNFVFGDVRDAARMDALFCGVDHVIHTAALKHVSSCELAPREAIKTNILGVTNIISASLRNGVKRTLFTSSDKAVNPTNVMGTSKLMGERLISAAQIGHPDMVFASTRFGNVLGSHGSVFPLFRRQIARGGPVTITDPAMTRFVMTSREAVNLVLESLTLARGGDVFVSKMRALAIGDLAQVMINEFAQLYGHHPENIPIKIIGPKPGEKKYEELLTDEESGRALQLGKFYVILPAFRDLYDINYAYENAAPHPDGEIYRSSEQELMSQPEIAAYLKKNGLLAEGED